MYMNEKLVPEAMVLSKKIELATRFKLYHEKYASENFQVMNYGIGGKISGHADSQGETVEKSVEVEGRPGKLHSYTVGEKKDSTKRYLWSKTILTIGSVCWPGVDPPPRKINIFFLRSLALSVPIYRHFQSNGANWRSIKR